MAEPAEPAEPAESPGALAAEPAESPDALAEPAEALAEPAKALAQPPTEPSEPLAEPTGPAAEALAEPAEAPAEQAEAPAEQAGAPSTEPDAALPETQPEGQAEAPRRPASRLRRVVTRAALPLGVAAVAAFVAGTGYLAITDRPPTDDMGRWGAHPLATAPAAVATATPDWSADGAVNPFGLPTAAALRGAPTRLRVKAIGIDTALESLHLGADGALVPPKGFAKAGWYADGTAPGDRGPAVIAGHVDSKRGPAVFYRLRELEAGDRIEVVRGGRTVRFTVISTAWYPKTKFPAAKVYGPTPDRQLRLITCGGVFDHGLRSYKDNLVVYAVAG